MPAFSLPAALKRSLIVLSAGALVVGLAPTATAAAAASTAAPAASAVRPATVLATVATTAVTTVKAGATVTVGNSRSAYGTSALVPVVVRSTSSTPTGAVRAYFHGTPITGARLVAGRVTLRLPATWTPGTRTVNIGYLGDANTLTAAKAITVTTVRAGSSVVASTTTASYGSGAVVRATVRGAGSRPTGVVQIYQGSTWLASKVLSGGAAVVALPKSLSPGTRTLTVSYPGTALHTPGRMFVTSRIVAATPTVAATATAVTTGHRSTVSVTVRGAGSTPTGTVTVTRSGKTYGSRSLASGRASVLLPVFGAGSFAFTVTYHGSSRFKARATTVTVRVSKPVVAPKPPVSYANCTDVWRKLGRSIYPSDPGFQSKFDADHDGIGCEVDPR